MAIYGSSHLLSNLEKSGLGSGGVWSFILNGTCFINSRRSEQILLDVALVDDDHHFPNIEKHWFSWFADAAKCLPHIVDIQNHPFCPISSQHPFMIFSICQADLFFMANALISQSYLVTRNLYQLPLWHIEQYRTMQSRCLICYH